MRLLKKFFLLFFASLLFSSCFEDFDDNGAYASEINDFIWKGMNLMYLYKEEISDLSNDRFNNSDDYASYLNSFTRPEDLFESLIYERQNIDKYSYIVDNYTELQQSQQGISISNGMEFGLAYVPNSSSNIYGFVRYVHPQSPADENGIKRGDIFIAINNTILNSDNYLDLLNLDSYSVNFANYLDNNSETTNDDIIELNEIDIYLTKIYLEKNPIFLSKIFTNNQSKIGYLMYNRFLTNFENNLNSIFSEFKSNDIQNLILDFRYNPGGAIDNAVFLSSLITGQFNEEIFSSDQWNNEIQEFWLNNNPENLIRRFQTYENSLFLNKIYILTTRSTASASELVINSLNPYIDVIHIGETTYGKYQGSLTLYDSENFSIENINPTHNYALQPLVFKILNAIGNTDYYDGLQPDYLLQEFPANMGEIGYENEPLLNFTLDLINSKEITSKRFPNVNFFDDNFRFEHLNKEMYIE